MKVTSRTPPVRISAAAMVAYASLPPEISGWLLRWGMRSYGDNVDVPIEEARRETRMDDRTWSMLLDAVRDLIDQQALAAGFMVVRGFAEASEALARVSASRVREAAGTSVRVNDRRPSRTRATPARTRTAAPAPVVRAIDIRRDADEPMRQMELPVEPVALDEWDAVAATLIERGADPIEVGEAILRWRIRHPIDEVMTSIHATADRRIAKPVRYIQTMLDNALTARRQSMPSEIRLANSGPKMPRPVKRRVQVAVRSGWTFEGWTARGHPRGGATIEDRREIWRNEAGLLSYKQTAEDRRSTIPTYEDDAGLYETD